MEEDILTVMTTEDVKQEIERDPFIPLKLHLASGQKIAIEYPNSSFVRQNTLLVVHRLEHGTAEIGNYDVIALRLIERIEQVSKSSAAGRGKRKDTQIKRCRNSELFTSQTLIQARIDTNPTSAEAPFQIRQSAHNSRFHGARDRSAKECFKSPRALGLVFGLEIGPAQDPGNLRGQRIDRDLIAATHVNDLPGYRRFF